MNLRARVQAGEKVFGGWVQVGHGTSAEILARAGFDWLAVDMEHTDIGIAAFGELIRAAEAAAPDMPVLARVRENDTLAIRQVLDLGAAGVIVPLVSTVEEARRAVAAAKYPPEGVRGFAFVRGNRWGVDFDAYVGEANARTLVIAMIETREAIENIDEILAVEGIDGVLIGPYDLSGSYGMPGQTSAPVVVQGCETVIAACNRAGKAAGLHVVHPSPQAVQQAVEARHRFIALGMDSVFLAEGAKAALDVVRGA